MSDAEEKGLLDDEGDAHVTVAEPPHDDDDEEGGGHGEYTIRKTEMKKKPKRKDEEKAEKERLKKAEEEKKKVRYQLRPKASYYEHNMVGAACISICALAPLVCSIFALLAVVEDMAIEPESDEPEIMDLGGQDEAQQELFNILCVIGFGLDIGVAFVCMLSGVWGLFAISSRLISQVKVYMRALLVVMGLLILPAAVYGVYVAIFADALYFHWPFGQDEELSAQSKGPTIVLFLLVMCGGGLFCMIFYYYGSLMYKDELKEAEQARRLLKQGKRPPPGRVAPWWLDLIRYMVPTKEQIIWFCTDPVVGVAFLILVGAAYVILGGLSVTDTYSAGFYLVGGGVIRILIALYGFRSIKQKSPLKIFQYGRLLVLGLLLFVISAVAFVGAMTREPPDPEDAENVIVRTESPQFLTAIGTMVGIECLGLFWCMYCAIDHAKYLQDVAIIQKTSAIESYMKGLGEEPALPAGGKGEVKEEGKGKKKQRPGPGKGDRKDTGAGVSVAV